MTKQEINKHTSEENQMKSGEGNCTEETPKKFWDIENFKMWIVIISVILIAFYISVYLCINNAGDRGTFGDTFGAVNALFSGLAFAGMYVALTLQRKEFKLQREEFEKNTDALKSQKEEMTNQKKELEQQKKIMAEQLKLAGISQVESTLFYMLGQHDNIINCLSAKTPKAINGMPNYTVIKGIDYINHLNDKIIKPNERYYLDDSERIKLFPYINNLMQIFKYIDETDVLKNDDDVDDEFEKRHKYCSMVTSSLSNNELILIDYYLSIYTGIELNRLCTIYALLENKKNPNESKPNGPKYNIDEAKGYFKTDRERKIKEGKRK
jgi:hypothetical protein